MLPIINNYRKNFKIISIAVLLFTTSCFIFSCAEKHSSRNIERAFYYWKSVFKLTDFEKSRMDSLQVNTIYLKFFDVDWDDESSLPLPKAIVQITDSAYLHLRAIKIIPTVFITNECLQKIDSIKIIELADKIIGLIKNIYQPQLYKQPVTEVQIDCDWSASTKNKYFNLLKRIRQNGVQKLTATIRLHQIKYLAKTGVPPVDKGLLMCYNMGNIKNPFVKNSILDTEELKKYIGKLANYPLQLDVALPLFEWFVLLRNNEYRGLIKKLDITGKAIKKQADGNFVFLTDTVINEIAFKKDDIVRYEKCGYDEVIKAAQIINSKLKTINLRLALFHLDSITLSKYSINEMENIYNSMY